MSQYFSKIATKAELAGISEKNSKKSYEWFIRELRTMRNINRRSLLQEKELNPRARPLIGRMFMYFYEPKGKDTMKYYDEFPLIIMVGPAENGFYGLNLHYLHPKLRAVFFDELLQRLNNKKMDKSTRFRLTYDMLRGAAKMRMFAPCFKKYLFSQVKSKTVEVPPDQWEIALFMPTDSFAGETRNKIWKESRDIFRSR